jgi:hypothetical protein
MGLFTTYCPKHPRVERGFCTACDMGDEGQIIHGSVNWRGRMKHAGSYDGVSSIVPSGQRARNESRARREAEAAQRAAAKKSKSWWS